jgi:hypothetical protein
MADKAELLEENYLLRKEVQRLNQLLLTSQPARPTKNTNPHSRRSPAKTSFIKRETKENTSKVHSASRVALLTKHQKEIKQMRSKIDSKINEISNRLSELKESKPFKDFQITTPQSVKGLEKTELSRTLRESLEFKSEPKLQTQKVRRRSQRTRDTNTKNFKQSRQ